MSEPTFRRTVMFEHLGFVITMVIRAHEEVTDEQMLSCIKDYERETKTLTQDAMVTVRMERLGAPSSPAAIPTPAQPHSLIDCDDENVKRKK
jgi:hypothetical protein